MELLVWESRLQCLLRCNEVKHRIHEIEHMLNHAMLLNDLTVAAFADSISAPFSRTCSQIKLALFTQLSASQMRYRISPSGIPTSAPLQTKYLSDVSAKTQLNSVKFRQKFNFVNFGIFRLTHWTWAESGRGGHHREARAGRGPAGGREADAQMPDGQHCASSKE